MLKKKSKISFEKELYKPVLRCSICTGEQVAGFREIKTGKFIEVMLIRTPLDLDAFMEEYDVDTIAKEY